jgi:hypothetical protein
MKVMNKLPTQKQVNYLRKALNKHSIKQIQVDLGVPEKTVHEWMMVIFNNRLASTKWRHIKQELDFYDANTDELMSANEYNVGGHFRETEKPKRIYSPARMFYLVTINHNYSYVVKFTEPVPLTSIQYSKTTTQCDYEVQPLGHWEYGELRDTLPTVSIDAQYDYVGLFWYTFKIMLHEA